jgi:hypothetical protein
MLFGKKFLQFFNVFKVFNVAAIETLIDESLRDA